MVTEVNTKAERQTEPLVSEPSVAEHKLKKALARASLLQQRTKKCKQVEDTSASAHDGKDRYNESTRDIKYIRQHRKIVRSWKMHTEVLPDDEVDFMHLFGKETLPAHDLISEDKFLAQHSFIFSLRYLFLNSFSSTTMGDANPIRTLGDYSKPSNEGYRNTIELPKGNNVFFPPGRTAELRNDILMFQQHQDESLYDAWTRFKDLLLKVPHHGLELWFQVQIFYDHVDYTTRMAIEYAVGGRLRKLRPEVAWETIEDLAQYEKEGWNDPIFLEDGSLNYKNAGIEQLLGAMECRVDTLMKDVISLMGRSENVYGISSNMMRQLPAEPPRQEAFEYLVMNFILDQEEKVRQLEEYMCREIKGRNKK
ncbi:zinc finger, CCHC-type containing protein [Tanacetum coccineum]